MGGSGRDPYYAYKGGPRLPDEYGSPEFIAAFVAAKEQKSRKKSAEAKVMLSLLNGYQNSAEFKVLAERTKTEARVAQMAQAGPETGT